MISVKIYYDEYKNIKKYNVSGHANYDSYGKDIVCAAISVLSTTALNALIYVCEIDEKDINYNIQEETGYLTVELPLNIENAKLEKSQIVLETLELGIKSVIESYPKYVTLKYGEV